MIKMIIHIFIFSTHPVLRVESEPVSVLAARVVSYLPILIVTFNIIMMIAIIMMITIIMRIAIIMMITMITIIMMIKTMMKELTAMREVGKGRGQEARI